MRALAPLQLTRNLNRLSKSITVSRALSRGMFSTTGDSGGQKEALYLHIGPGGDSWTGASIFAAKHLQPDYVKSILLPKDCDEDSSTTEALLAAIEEDASLQRQIYDEERIPPSLLEKARETR
jgi:hypothetical protein